MGALLNTYYRKKRYVMYAITTLFIMGIPFITIGGNQIFLLSFDKKQLHLLGMAFDMQELYLMPFLLIMLFVGIFLLTTLAGRTWCGWACPHTIFRVIYRDLIETTILGLRHSISNKQRATDFSKASNKLKKILAVVIWICLALIASANFLWYFVPPSDFFSYLADYKNHSVLLVFLVAIATFLTLEIIFVGEVFCIYICPYCRVQSVLYDNDTKTVIYDTNRGSKIYDDKGVMLSRKEISGECVSCLKCVQVCPTHIDIRKGLQLECINCLECADACSDTMGKLGKISLIRWSSTNAMATNGVVKYLRGKTAGYIVVLLIALSMAIFLSTTKSTMLLNINRTTEAYKILPNGEVENHYVMLFQNTDNKPHRFYLEVDNPNVSIRQPKEAFELGAGKKVRKRVYLYATQNPSDGKDNITHLKIRAYAVDDENIHITKESIFVYPQQK